MSTIRVNLRKKGCYKCIDIRVTIKKTYGFVS